MIGIVIHKALVRIISARPLILKAELDRILQLIVIAHRRSVTTRPFYGLYYTRITLAFITTAWILNLGNDILSFWKPFKRCCVVISTAANIHLDADRPLFIDHVIARCGIDIATQAIANHRKLNRILSSNCITLLIKHGIERPTNECLIDYQITIIGSNIIAHGSDGGLDILLGLLLFIELFITLFRSH